MDNSYIYFVTQSQEIVMGNNRRMIGLTGSTWSMPSYQKQKQFQQLALDSEVINQMQLWKKLSNSSSLRYPNSLITLRGLLEQKRISKMSNTTYCCTVRIPKNGNQYLRKALRKRKPKSNKNNQLSYNQR